MFHTLYPVFLAQEKLRRAHIVTAPEVHNTQIVPAVLLTVILRLYPQPLLDFVLMTDKIILCLEIPIQQSVVFYFKQFLVRIGNIYPVG